MSLIKNLQRHHVFVAIVMLCAAFFFFWNLPNTVQFQGDQGRDAIIVSNIFRLKDPVFIGPVTSVGNMYLGPLYYYFMLPFLFLSYPSPLGPVYAVGILALITVFLMYRLGAKLFNQTIAFIAIVLYGFSSTVATYARFSWNPNPAPLVSLLMIFFTYKAWQENKKYWVLVAVCFSILIQLHYLTLLSLGGAGIIWLLQAKQLISTKKIAEFKSLLFVSLLSVLLFVVSLTPLILFDLKHEGLNGKAFINLFTKETVFTESANVSLLNKITETLEETHGRSLLILFEMLVGSDMKRNTALLVLMLGALALIFRKVSTQHRAAVTVLLAYICVGIVGTALYESDVYTHYIIYLLPPVVLLHSFILSHVPKDALTKFCLAILLAAYIFKNSHTMPLGSIGWTISDVQRTSDSIYSRLQPGEKYNIVLLSESKDIDGQNYRYFLSTTDTPPLPIERRGETETLFIINESREIDRVVDSPIYEIVVFPDKNVKEVFTVENGPEITVLKK